MFTGIVEELGTIAEVTDQGDAIRLTVAAATVLEGTGLGDSISVNGCCLTVSELGDGTWTADLMQETLDKTSLRGVRPGDRVNLEFDLLAKYLERMLAVRSGNPADVFAGSLPS